MFQGSSWAWQRSRISWSCVEQIVPSIKDDHVRLSWQCSQPPSWECWDEYDIRYELHIIIRPSHLLTWNDSQRVQCYLVALRVAFFACSLLWLFAFQSWLESSFIANNYVRHHTRITIGPKSEVTWAEPLTLPPLSATALYCTVLYNFLADLLWIGGKLISILKACTSKSRFSAIIADRSDTVWRRTHSCPPWAGEFLQFADTEMRESLW